MKVLHYLFGLPPVYIGGLVVYAMSLASAQTGTNEVSILIPADAAEGDSIVEIYPDNRRYNRVRKKNQLEEVNIYSIRNALPVSYGWGVDMPVRYMQKADEKIYDEFLEKLSPDIIHMHSIMGIHAEFMKAARKRNIPIVYTTHDFYGFCMNAKLYNSVKGCICNNVSGTECRECCADVRPYRRIVFDQSSGYRFLQETGIYRLISKNILAMTLSEYRKKHRKAVLQNEEGGINRSESEKRDKEYIELIKYYRNMLDMVDIFLYNSQQTKMIYSGLGYGNGENIGISDINICDRRKAKTLRGDIVIGYLGAQNALKGYQRLLDAADSVAGQGYRNFRIVTYGDFDPVRPYLIKRGKYNASDMDNVYTSMDILVVPSIWMETYGLVVAEAISFGTPVIVSECVGAVEILGKTISEEAYGRLCEYGIIYNGGKEKLTEILLTICESPEIINDMNKRINYTAEIKNIQWKSHLDKIVKTYQTIIKCKQGENKCGN